MAPTRERRSSGLVAIRLEVRQSNSYDKIDQSTKTVKKQKQSRKQETQGFMWFGNVPTFTAKREKKSTKLNKDYNA